MPVLPCFGSPPFRCFLLRLHSFSPCPLIECIGLHLITYDVPINWVIVGGCITEPVALVGSIHAWVKRTEDKDGMIRIDLSLPPEVRQTVKRQCTVD